MDWTKKAGEMRRDFKKGHHKWARHGSFTNNGETWKLGRTMLGMALLSGTFLCPVCRRD